MLVSAIVAKLMALGILCMVWLALFQYVKRLDAGLPFHVAAYQRDRRKARFYFYSVWVGVIVAFFSFVCLDAMASLVFDSNAERDLVIGVTRAVGMWGLLIAAAVWSQVGQRVGQHNSDGQSLQLLPNEREKPQQPDARRRR